MNITYAGVALNSGNRESPSNFAVSFSRVVQSTALTRATHAKIFARKNSLLSISFSIVYQKTDLREAQEFTATLDEWLPSQGPLLLEPIGDGGTVQEIIYERATLQSASAQPIGVTVVVAFSFLAENRLITPEPPTQA